MEIDRWLAPLTRRAAHRRGSDRFIRPLQARFSRIYAALPSAECVISDYDGTISMHLDRSSYIGGSIYWRGFHHHALVWFVKSFLKADMTFVDVGANQGELTLLAAKYLTRGLVLAFEPEARMFSLLERNLRSNNFSNARAFNLGLGDTQTTQKLYAGPSTHAGQEHNEGLFTAFPEADQKPIQEFQVKRLDDLLSGLGIDRVDLMKVDAEGAELFVLRGAEQCIGRDRPELLIEINTAAFERAGYETSSLLQMLHRYHYQLYELRPVGKIGQTFQYEKQPIQAEDVARREGCFDIICTHMG